MSAIPDDIMHAASKAYFDAFDENDQASIHAVLRNIGAAILSERQRTDDLIEEVRKEARRGALEEAAAWHDRKAEKFGNLSHANKHNHVLADKLAADVIKHQCYAAAIRTLSDSTLTPLQEQNANSGKEGE